MPLQCDWREKGGATARSKTSENPTKPKKTHWGEIRKGGKKVVDTAARAIREGGKMVLDTVMPLQNDCGMNSKREVVLGWYSGAYARYAAESSNPQSFCEALEGKVMKHFYEVFTFAELVRQRQGMLPEEEDPTQRFLIPNAFYASSNV